MADAKPKQNEVGVYPSYSVVFVVQGSAGDVTEGDVPSSRIRFCSNGAVGKVGDSE